MCDRSSHCPRYLFGEIMKHIIVSLPDEKFRLLELLAEAQGVSINDAISCAISTEARIKQEVHNHSRILIEKSDGEIRELLFKYWIASAPNN